MKGIKEYYAGFSISDFKEHFPNLPDKKVLKIAEVLDQCTELFTSDGSLVKVTLLGKTTKTGIIRNCFNQLGKELFIEFELRRYGFFLGWFKAIKRIRRCNTYRHNESCIDLP